MKYKHKEFLGKKPEEVFNMISKTFVVRVILPMQPHTTELRGDRINFNVDENNIIKKVWFG